MSISNDTIEYLKQKKKLLIQRYCDINKYPSVEHPFTIFMAGSPGAGKTEFSRWFIKGISEIGLSEGIVRIDLDEIREFFPQYKKNNSHEVQSAAILGVGKIYDSVLKNKQSAVLDGTFAKYEKSRSNVQRSLMKRRKVGIFYLYQDPIMAWEFTKKRELGEGRHISKEFFIDSFFAARENVNRIKKEFRNKINVVLIIMDYTNNIEKSYFNIDNLDGYLKIGYDKETLSSKLC